MTVLQTLTALYDLLPLDKTLREYKLIELLKKDKVGAPIVFSLSEHIVFPQVGIKITPNDAKSTETMVLRAIDEILVSRSPVTVTKALKALNTKHQVVIKVLITKNVTFNREVVLHNISRLYTASDLALKLQQQLPKESTLIPYIITDDLPKYTYRTNRATVSNITSRKARPNVPAGSTYVTDGDTVVLKGDRSLMLYLKGESTEYTLHGEYQTMTIEEYPKILEAAKGKYLTIFRQTAETEYIPLDTIDIKPFDWLIDKNYNASGFLIRYEDKVYKLKHQITRKLLEAGVDTITLTITGKPHMGRLVRIEIKDVRINYESET